MMGGEDFGRYGRDGGVPIFLYFLGTHRPERVAAPSKEGGKPLPSLHSDSLRAGAGADHQDRRTDDEHGRAEFDGEVNRPFAPLRGAARTRYGQSIIEYEEEQQDDATVR